MSFRQLFNTFSLKEASYGFRIRNCFFFCFFLFVLKIFQISVVNCKIIFQTGSSEHYVGRRSYVC